MFKAKATFSSFSVDNLRATKKFYAQTLGLEVIENKMGLTLHLPEGGKVFIYPKDNHQPATFTVLNLVVDKLDEVVKKLKVGGVSFASYDKGMIKTDKNNIARGLKSGNGPDIAWFKDPAGNILSV